jgi:hypothetical protein
MLTGGDGQVIVRLDRIVSIELNAGRPGYAPD